MCEVRKIVKCMKTVIDVEYNSIVHGRTGNTEIIMTGVIRMLY